MCVFLPSSIASSMEDNQIQTWLHKNGYNNNNNYNQIPIFSESPSLSSSTATTSSQETHSTPTLCEDSSFNSLKSTACSVSKPSLSHLCIAVIKTTTLQISCLAVQNNNLYAASIKDINVFDLTTFELVDTFGSGWGLVKSIAFSGKKIFTAHQDCKIRAWRRANTTKKSNNYEEKLEHHHHQLVSTLPMLKDRFFKSMLAKNYVQVRRHKQKLWIEHADTVSGLAVDERAGMMYSVSWDKCLKIWRASTSGEMRCIESIRAHSDAVNAVAVSPLDGTVYTGSADGDIKVWRPSLSSRDAKQKQIMLSPSTLRKQHESSVNALALTRDGWLCSGGGDGVIHVWEREDVDRDMFVSCSLRGHRGAIMSLVCVNGVIISGSSDGTLRIWRYGKGLGVCLGVLKGHCKPVKALVVVPGGDLEDSLTVFSGSLDGEIRAWKVVISSDIDRD